MFSLSTYDGNGSLPERPEGKTGRSRQSGESPAISAGAVGNADVIGVAELDRRLRRAVESVSGREWVEGEVSSLRRAASGHVYFCLKDEREDAVIDCVMYRLQAGRARRALTEGARVQLLGKVTVWAPRGRLQLIADLVRPAGRGALLEALERLKEQLASEGLFAAERKRRLPREPKIVGVVTSLDGAAYHDIRSVAFRRGGARLVVCPAQVQGDAAVGSMLSAIDLLERYPGLDVLIVGRGGGSSDDLMAFNDERVVRRLSAVRVPVVSAVGHETDYTLTDLVADVRAATPSQAAELVIPDAEHGREMLSRCMAQLGRALHSRLGEYRHAIERLRVQLSDPRFLIAERQQHVDDLESRMERHTERLLSRRRARVEELHRRLFARHPRSLLAEARLEIEPLELRAGAALRLRLERARSLLGERATQLHGLSPLAVLGRGYAIVTDERGRVLDDAGAASVDQELSVKLHRGELSARVTALVPAPGNEPAS